MKKGLTKLELEKKRKKELAEAQEIIEATGQESESKARKWVREVAKEEEKKQKKQKDLVLEQLDLSKKKDLSYKQHLLRILHELVKQAELPKTYSWGVWYDGKGIMLAIKTPDNNYHRRAFRISYSPKHDLNVCFLYSYWAEKVKKDYEEKCLQKSILKP